MDDPQQSGAGSLGRGLGARAGGPAESAYGCLLAIPSPQAWDVPLISFCLTHWSHTLWGVRDKVTNRPPSAHSAPSVPSRGGDWKPHPPRGVTDCGREGWALPFFWFLFLFPLLVTLE